MIEIAPPALLALGFVAGWIAYGHLSGGAARGPKTDCPAEVKGYSCKGAKCDHRRSVLYKALSDMAAADEKAGKTHGKFWA